jgi:hypothetical protein
MLCWVIPFRIFGAKMMLLVITAVGVLNVMEALLICYNILRGANEKVGTCGDETSKFYTSVGVL